MGYSEKEQRAMAAAQRKGPAPPPPPPFRYPYTAPGLRLHPWSTSRLLARRKHRKGRRPLVRRVKVGGKEMLAVRPRHANYINRGPGWKVRR